MDRLAIFATTACVILSGSRCVNNRRSLRCGKDKNCVNDAAAGTVSFISFLLRVHCVVRRTFSQAIHTKGDRMAAPVVV